MTDVKKELSKDQDGIDVRDVLNCRIDEIIRTRMIILVEIAM
jgi:hypothetical protein